MFQRTSELCDERGEIWNKSPAFNFEAPSEQIWSLCEARTFLERGWKESVSHVSSPPVTELMTYALTGGKCLRGLLVLAVTECCNGSRINACGAAIAMEMLHAASLVVDDLPALDDACMRRLAPSLHKRFGECAAILTAHALVAAAFEVITHIPSEPERLLRIARLLAVAIGGRGMAYAELLTPQGPNMTESSAPGRALKTGGLFELAASIGATLAGADPELIADLGKLGLRLGVCYQVADDLRDDVMSERDRESLLEENRHNWRDCDRLYQLVRGRLQRSIPLEKWMAEFHLAGSEVALA